MARSLLREFGPESKPGGNRAECGGVTAEEKKDLPYSTPLGPKHQGHQRPGLPGGKNHGQCGTQGRH